MIQTEVLSNGIHILSEKITEVRSVAIGIWVRVGSRDENERNNGVSHFIEHLMFKGTKNRTAKQIAEALDAVGGQLNAFTSKEYTCYYAKVLDEHVDLAIDILSDMVLNSNFAEEDILKESNVVLEEIKMYEDTPDDMVHDLFTGTLLKGHPLGRPIIGTREIISSLKGKDIKEFYDDYYIPSNIIIAAAGNLEHDKIQQTFKEKFSSLQGDLIERKLVKSELAKNQAIYIGKEVEQVHLCLGGQGLAVNDKNIYTFHLLNNILGGGLSSRLFQKIREDLGLAYSVYSYHSSYQETGTFCIYAGLSLENMGKALETIYDELNSIKKQGFDADEIIKAKNQIKGSLFLGLESTSARMSRLGKSMMNLGKVLTPEEISRKLDKVSLEEVNSLADSIFSLENYSITAIGPRDKDIDLKKYLYKS